VAIGELGATDFRRVLDLLGVLHAAADLDEFADLVVQSISHVVAADIVAYNEVDPRTSRLVARTEPVDRGGLPKQWELWQRHADQHPTYEHVRRTGDGSARRISDFLDRREFHRLELYTELFRQLGVEYQVSTALPTPQPVIVALTLSRTRRDFTDREVSVLETLRPHLLQAYLNLQLRARLTGALATLDGAMAKGGWGAAQLAGDRVEPIAGPIGRWIDQYLEPRQLQEFIRRERSAADDALGIGRPLLAQRQHRRLIVRFLRGGDDPDLLLFDERAAEGGSSRLRDLGLTEREADVLLLVTRGASNSEMAASLGISVSAVKRHLERIYAKLAVTNRTAAAAHALEALTMWS
jgi:DNA-binding CsgD family transcriptional regulator